MQVECVNMDYVHEHELCEYMQVYTLGTHKEATYSEGSFYSDKLSSSPC